MILSHHVDRILTDEYPILYHTVRTSGLSVSTVVHQWWSQLFLNTLNWSDIGNYLLAVLTNGPEFIVYFCVALFARLEKEILDFRVVDKVEFLFQLKVTQVKKFDAKFYYPLTKKLAEKYKISLRLTEELD